LITDDEAFCSILLDECGGALIPGSLFDAPSHARLSYSGAAEQVDAGVSRLKEFLPALS
jgi:aspartate aminotransferase